MEQNNHAPGFAGLGLGNVPTAGLEYLRAEHELAYRQALFDMLLKQYDVAKLDEAKEAAIIQVVEPAIIPDRKSSPKRALLVVLFSISGFFAGCSLSWIIWQKTVLLSDQNSGREFRNLKFALLGR